MTDVGTATVPALYGAQTEDPDHQAADHRGIQEDVVKRVPWPDDHLHQCPDRCHTIADALGMRAAAYHAGLTSQERRDVEMRFLQGKMMAVVTTAALGAGVDFPASQVIFDALAMGRDWLSVQEFNQMAGRAGRPDFHDLGKSSSLRSPVAVIPARTHSPKKKWR